MIITRSPLRISLGGGGTDLPSYYREHGGFVLSAAIDKYIYITLHRTFIDEMILKYSQLERVDQITKIQHPIMREALLSSGINQMNLEITSMADIPSGTGLGSSGSFATALIRALFALRKRPVEPAEIAAQACHIEIERLGEPIGKQDQYIAAFGGITSFEFTPDDRVVPRQAGISEETLFNLEDNLLLFFTGYSRQASSILKDQDQRSKTGDLTMLEKLHQVKANGFASLRALEEGNLEEFAAIMNHHWEEKRSRSQGMSNETIDQWYNLARRNGALGGKLIGAGGGGFLMFYASDKQKLRHVLREAGLKEVRFRFDFEGTKVISTDI